jgi:hypothetical protein
LVDRVGRNPSGESTFVTFAERSEKEKEKEIDSASWHIEGEGESVQYKGQEYNRLPNDAGLPTHFSKILRSPDEHFGEGHGLGALSQAVEASFQATEAVQTHQSEEATFRDAESRHGQYTSALTRLPGLKKWYGGKVAYANEAQYLASPQAWKYQKVLPRGLRTAVSTGSSALASGAAYVLGAPVRWWRGGKEKAD